MGLGRIAYNKHAYYMLRMQTERLGFVLADVARLMRRRFDQRARTLGFTRAQWQVLIALSRNEGIHQAGLADYLDVENITLCRMVDRLEEAELVERRPDPNDRRVRRLYLTPTAVDAIGRMQTVGNEVQEEALAGLSPEARDQLMATLVQVRGNLSNKSVEAVASAAQG